MNNRLIEFVVAYRAGKFTENETKVIIDELSNDKTIPLEDFLELSEENIAKAADKLN